MNAAQVAWCCLTALFLAAGTVLYLLDAEIVGGFLLALASLGYFMLIGMILSHARSQRSPE